MGKRLSVDAKTPLERHVKAWINGHADGYDDVKGVLEDLFHGGCASGMVGHLIYYNDTVRFFKRHREEINTLLVEYIDGTGEQPATLFGDKWDTDDPLALDTLNQNLLSWFGFEETARKLAERANVEI
jgi:hypothetical protein